MFKAVPFEPDKHYPIAKRWWIHHGWALAPELWELSPDGIVVTFNDEPVAMVWLFESKRSPHACAQWFIAARNVSKEVRNHAIDHLIDAAEIVAKGWGVKQLGLPVKNRRLVKRLCDKGFRVGDRGMSYALKEYTYG